MFTKILIPLDDAVRPEDAFKLVSHLFPAENVELILLESTNNAVSTFPAYTEGEKKYGRLTFGADRRKPAEAVAGFVATKTAKLPFPKLCGYSVFGDLDDAIVKVAKSEKVDLIVMLTHGLAGLERIGQGSLMEKVIQKAPCPTLAIRSGHIPDHILIALDGTPVSEGILEPALALAQLFRADVTLARIDVPADETTSEEPASLLTHYPNRSELYLNAIVGRFSQFGRDLDIRIDYQTDYGRPGKRIPKLAEKHDCDLVAMAISGHQSFFRLLNWSVTADVMDQARTAIFTLNPINH